MVLIEQSKQKGKSFEIIIDGRSKIILPEAIVFEYSIFTDRRFTEQSWQEILEAASKYECFEKTMRLLSVKAYTEFELKKKLNQKGFSSADISSALEKAKTLNLVNDFSIVNQFILEQLEFGRFGRNRIIQKLQRRGINSELVRSTINKLYSNHSENNIELLNARKVGENKLRLLEREHDFRKKKEKLLRFLAGRGFSSSVCYDVAAQLLSNNKYP